MPTASASVPSRWPSIVILSAGLVAACASAPANRAIPFDETDYAAYTGNGTSSITGEVDFKPLFNGRETGVRCEEAILMPVTRYSTEWITREVIGGEKLSDPDPRIEPYLRKSQLRGANHVHFYNLPAGSYYMACRMTSSRWFMGRRNLLMFGQRGWSYAKATVGSGEHVAVKLQAPLLNQSGKQTTSY